MRTNHKHLSCEESTMIQLSLEQGCTLSSISLKLKRNGWSNPATEPRKRGYVECLLRESHAPEQFAGILRRMRPDESTLKVSHKTIYTALYAMQRGELRSELIACLRPGRKSRRLRVRGEDGQGTSPT